MANKRRNQCPNDPSHPVSDWIGKYDNFACLVCDIWTDPDCTCDPKECEFKEASLTKPERPSMMNK
jgi:hypothetical protein